jgi:hypothetical protein
MKQQTSLYAEAQGHFNFNVEEGDPEIVTLGYKPTAEPSPDDTKKLIIENKIDPLAKAQSEFDFDNDKKEEVETIGCKPPSENFISYDEIYNKNNDLTRIITLPILHGHNEYFVVRVEREYKSGEVYKEPDHYWPTLPAANKDVKDWFELAEKCDW